MNEALAQIRDVERLSQDFVLMVHSFPEMAVARDGVAPIHRLRLVTGELHGDRARRARPLATLVPLLMPSDVGAPEVGLQVVVSSGLAGPVMMNPFNRSAMFGAPNWMHGVVVMVHVTLPMS